jgi:hypothetical protein
MLFSKNTLSKSDNMSAQVSLVFAFGAAHIARVRWKTRCYAAVVIHSPQMTGVLMDKGWVGGGNEGI